MKRLATKIIISSYLILNLVGCSLNHKNLLERINPEDSSKFLVAASNYAEVKMNKHLYDKGYESCMDQKLDRSTCITLYQYMLDYAKTQPLFKTLTLNDLTDMDAWQKLKEYYDDVVFNQLPQEVDTLHK